MEGGAKPKRSFTVEDSEVKVTANTRYKSTTPRGAALKAVRHMYDNGATKKEIKFTIRETTQGSDKKEYSYYGAKFDLKTPKEVKIGNTTVTYNHVYEVRRCGPNKVWCKSHDGKK
jgi:hypothetical protein